MDSIYLLEHSPHTDAVVGLIERDANGFILTGTDLINSEHKYPHGWTLDCHPFLLETNVPGIFAVEMCDMAP